MSHPGAPAPGAYSDRQPLAGPRTH